MSNKQKHSSVIFANINWLNMIGIIIFMLAISYSLYPMLNHSNYPLDTNHICLSQLTQTENVENNNNAKK